MTFEKCESMLEFITTYITSLIRVKRTTTCTYVIIFIYLHYLAKFIQLIWNYNYRETKANYHYWIRTIGILCTYTWVYTTHTNYLYIIIYLLKIHETSTCANNHVPRIHIGGYCKSRSLFVSFNVQYIKYYISVNIIQRYCLVRNFLNYSK